MFPMNVIWNIVLCDTEARTYRLRARMCNIPDKYIEESKDDNDEEEDESEEDDESEEESEPEDNENFTQRLNGRGRRVRRRLV